MGVGAQGRVKWGWWGRGGGGVERLTCGKQSVCALLEVIVEPQGGRVPPSRLLTLHSVHGQAGGQLLALHNSLRVCVCP